MPRRREDAKNQKNKRIAQSLPLEIKNENMMKSTLYFLCLVSFLSGVVPGYSQAENVCLSAQEKLLYDLIMEYRKSKKLKPIPFSAKLTKVAQAHVRDLEDNFEYELDDNNKIARINPKNTKTFQITGDCNLHSWSDKGSWSSCCYTADHSQAQCMWDKPKEIAGYDGEGYEIAYIQSGAASAKEAIEGWKKSSGHNPLLINSETWSKLTWGAIGIGIYGKYGVVWFGEKEDKSKIVVCR